MKFLVNKASNFNYEEYIEINNLEELKALSEKYNRELVISFNFTKEFGKIIIYDDYLE